MPLLNKNFFFLSSQVLNKFISKSFKAGKKERFETAFYKVLIRLARTVKIPTIFLIFETFEKIKPIVGLSTRIIKKKKTFVPSLITVYRQYGYAFGWMRSMFRAKPLFTKPLAYKLENCFFQISAKFRTTSCSSEKKKLYSTAISNRVHRHFRW